MRADIVPGGIFPNYDLLDHTGQMRKLTELQGDAPMILTLARGHYCPKEHPQHLNSPRFTPRSPSRTQRSSRFQLTTTHPAGVSGIDGAQSTFLSDPDRTVQKDLDTQEYTDPEHNPMIPHTLVPESGLVIYSIYSGYWFWGRLPVIDLWHDLRVVTREIRPDWDLSTRGFRDAWNAGDLSRFNG